MPKKKPPEPGGFLLDNTVISNFCQAGRLDILKSLLGDMGYVTTHVLSEARAGANLGKFSPDLMHAALSQGWLKATDPGPTEYPVMEGLLDVLGRGEASCLAIAKQRQWVLATDDRKARQFATAMAVQVTGTIGLLVAAVERGIASLEEANDLLHALSDFGYFSPIAKLDDLIERGDR